MSINVRAKGQEGEREIADRLNYLMKLRMRERGLPVPVVPIVQRNQNQSAVGGNDLANTMGLSIEVKRQETLAVDSWWAQTVAAAKRNNEVPVLLYRQNRKAWHCVLPGKLDLPQCVVTGGFATIDARVTITWEAFQEWFSLWVDRKLANGEIPVV